ncbi:hypothetical protein K3495_g12518 [Podosphaera aphanis]|nr:hypothetical protein K3495_g12518 [Podosphaera aphanis]
MPLSSEKTRIAAAVKDFQEGKFPSKRRAAQAHDIDHKTLAANLVAPTGKSGGHNKVLNDAQEEALREYCDRCIRMNTEQELIERSEKERKKRDQNANKVVQKYGVLEAGAARLRIAERNKWEESLAEIDSKRREEVEIKRMQKWYRAIRSEAWKKDGQWLTRQWWRKAYTSCLPGLLHKTNMILSRIS